LHWFLDFIAGGFIYVVVTNEPYLLSVFIVLSPLPFSQNAGFKDIF
jgi:hypothetical protein